VAHSLSSKKRIRQNVKQRARNRTRSTMLKTKLRKVADAFLHGSTQDTEAAIKNAAQLLDREANRGTLHRNAAARRKSRLAKRLNAAKKQAATATT